MYKPTNVQNKDIWRVTPSSTTVVAACQRITLETGTLVVNVTKTILLNNATFTPHCYDQGLSLSAGSKKLPSLLQLINMPASLLNGTSSMFTLWQPSFGSSDASICIIIGAATAINWVLFLALISSLSQRPLFLKLAALVAVVCMSVSTSIAINEIEIQYASGYTDGGELQNYLSSSRENLVLIALSSVFLLLAQVQTIIRLFNRRKEKKIIAWVGGVFAGSSGVFNLINIFASPNPSQRTNSSDALVVFAYLFSIATAIIYDSCIWVYTIMKLNVVFKLDTIALTVICHISSFAPIVLFVLDLANFDVDGWSTLFNLVCLLCSTVSAWSWINKIEDIEKTLEFNSVLGKQIYAEDMDRKSPKNVYDKNVISKDTPTISVEQTKSIRSDNQSPQEQQQQQHHHHQQTDSSSIKIWDNLWNALTTWNFHRPGTGSSTNTSYHISKGLHSNNITPSNIASLANDNNTNILPVSTNDIRPVYNYPFRPQRIIRSP